MATMKQTPERGKRLNVKYLPKGSFVEAVPDPFGLELNAKPCYVE